MSELTIERVTPADSTWISEIQNPYTEYQFGRANIIKLTEHSSISLSLHKNGVPVAFIALSDQPLQSNWHVKNNETNGKGSLASNHWDDYLHHNTEISEIFKPWNTLWIQYFVSKSDDNEGYFHAFLKYVFQTQYQIHSILVGMHKQFSGVLPAALFRSIHSCGPESNNFNIFAARREDICPCLHIRSAAIEDTDDVTELITKDSALLTKHYGDFILAEIIDSTDNKNKYIVAEGLNNKACAFMGITTENLDLLLLKQCFNLEHFSNFNTKSVAAVQIFAIEKEYEQRSFDILAAAFAQFPTTDYLLLTVPKGKNLHIMNLLKVMVRITPKTHSSYPDELYICHKDSIMEDFKVRTIREIEDSPEDYRRIKQMVGNQNFPLKGGLTILKYMDDYFKTGVNSNNNLNLKVYVVTVVNTIVGICIIQDEEDIEYIRSHYDIEKFIHYNSFYRKEHGQILAFQLLPIFLPLASTFLREIMRLSGKACFYSKVGVETSVNKNGHISCISNMLALQLRKQIDYENNPKGPSELQTLGQNAPSNRVLQEQFNGSDDDNNDNIYSLLHINKKLTMHHKIQVPDQIVVLGASDVGLTFLRELIHQPHLIFTNLILVNEGGLSDYSRSANSLYSNEEIQKIGLPNFVNVVDGIATQLDRNQQYLFLSDGSKIRYDTLILTTGLEFCLKQIQDDETEGRIYWFRG